MTDHQAGGAPARADRPTDDCPTVHHVDRLREGLARRADEEGLLDVAWRDLDSPVGRLLVAATPLGVVRIGFATEPHDAVLAELAAGISPRVLRAPSRLDETARALDAWFADPRRSPDIAVDLQLARGFRAEVLAVLRTIPPGQTRSYAQVAAATNHPRAVRAVGTACARNPVPLVIPCHRVVRADGSTGSYRGGPEAKALLLRREADCVR